MFPSISTYKHCHACKQTKNKVKYIQCAAKADVHCNVLEINRSNKHARDKTCVTLLWIGISLCVLHRFLGTSNMIVLNECVISIIMPITFRIEL